MLAVTHPLQLCNESRALVYVSANNYTALQNYRTSRISGFFSRLTRVCNGIYCGEKVYKHARTAFRPCSIGTFGMQVKGPTGLLSHQRNRIIPQKAQVVIVGITTLDRDVFITQKM